MAKPKLHAPSKNKQRHIRIDGVSCPGCGGPVLRNDKFYWCADAPGSCEHKNLLFRIGDITDKAKNIIK